MNLHRIVATAITAVAFSTAFSSAASAQCLDVTFTPYGKGCVFLFAAPELSGTADASTCTLDLTATVPPTCCNTFPVGRLLLIGLSPEDLPFPEVGPTCTLLVDPLLLVSIPAAPDTLSFHVPPSVPSGTTVFVQHAVDYFTTIGLTHDFALSNGLRVDFD